MPGRTAIFSAFPILPPERSDPLAYIPYIPADHIPERDRIPDRDNILRIHGINPRVMSEHYQFYITLMRRPGPLSRVQREMIAVVVSSLNECHY